MMNNNSTQILEGSQKARKVYGFDEGHNSTEPAQHWFQESDEGLILFIVFYTQACRWSRCLGCNLPSKMSSTPISYKSLLAQVDWLFQHPDIQQRQSDIQKVIVSNNGSVLDQETFSSTALMYLLIQLNLNLPNLRLLSLETRVEYVDVAELEFISRALLEGETPTQLELAIGFEVFDDYIRNQVFDKGLSLHGFEEFVQRLSQYGYRLKCYFMQKPVPEMTDEAGIQDIQRAIAYLHRIATQYHVPINLHLNPTYVASGTLLVEAFQNGHYMPPRLCDVATAILAGKNTAVSIFVGLFDEGLAIEGGSFLRPGDEDWVTALEHFNRTQDYDRLEQVLLAQSFSS